MGPTIEAQCSVETSRAPGPKRQAHYEYLLLRTGPVRGDGARRLSKGPAASIAQAPSGGLVRDFGATLAGGVPRPTRASEARAHEDYADQLRSGRQTPEQVIRTLGELLWQTYKAQAALAEVAQQELDEALRTRANPHPELSLLVSFVELYGHAQRELNDIRRRHLDYCYGQVLEVVVLAQPDLVPGNRKRATVAFWPASDCLAHGRRSTGAARKYLGHKCARKVEFKATP